MANIKLKDNNWEASGIYDLDQQKNQRQINAEQAELKSAITPVPITWVDGYYRGADGTVVEQAGWKYCIVNALQSNGMQFGFIYKLRIVSLLAHYIYYLDENEKTLSYLPANGVSVAEGTTQSPENCVYIVFNTQTANSDIYVKPASMSATNIIRHDIKPGETVDPITIKGTTVLPASNMIVHSAVQEHSYIGAGGIVTPVYVTSNTRYPHASTDFIPVTGGATYYFSGLLTHYYAYYDEDKELISYEEYDTLGNSPVTVPSTAVYARYTLANYSGNEWFSTDANCDGTTKYVLPDVYANPLVEEPAPTMSFYVPLAFDFVLGYDGYMDFSGTIKTEDKFDELNDNLFWRTGGSSVAALASYEDVRADKFHAQKITPLSTGNVLSRIFVGKNDYYPGSANYYASSDPFRIYVNSPLTNPATKKNVLVIGDSYTGAYIWLPYMVGTYMSNLSNYNFIGQMNQSNLEGYPAVHCQAEGGYTWQNYVNDPATLPAGYPLNPFWYNGALDIESYVNDYAGTGESLDYVICLVGINSIVNNAYFGDDYNFSISSAMTGIQSLAGQFINHVHTNYPDCKILLCGYPYTPRENVNATNWATKTLNDAVAEMNKVYRGLSVPKASWVRFCQTNMRVNRFTAHKTQNVYVDAYDTETVRSFDYIHLTDNGYKQLADAIYCGFCGLVNN